MHIRELSGKNICILGYGREGRAVAQALQEHTTGCTITIADQNESTDVPKAFHAQLGARWLENLESFDVLIVSPGIPPLPEIRAAASKTTSATQIFFDTVRESGATIVGVTGSKGKSTTSTLLYEILKNAGKHAFLVGNIGEPAIAHLKDATKETIFVHELSSYQLMNLKASPTIAIITAFFPEHLDYHGSYESYLEAKKHITRFQGKDDAVFFSGAMPETEEIAKESKGTRIRFMENDAPVTLDDILLKGTHNLRNIAGAWKAAERLGVDKETAIRVIKDFKGLPHRLEMLGTHHKCSWVNDSISTTPESAVAALDALGDDVRTLIVGGQDRGYDFDHLAKRVASSKVQTVILLPDSGFLIGKAIERAGAHVLLVPAKTMQDAVREAMSHTEEGTVLLSPASPSYGHFKNFEDRGQQFKEAVQH